MPSSDVDDVGVLWRDVHDHDAADGRAGLFGAVVDDLGKLDALLSPTLLLFTPEALLFEFPDDPWGEHVKSVPIDGPRPQVSW